LNHPHLVATEKTDMASRKNIRKKPVKGRILKSVLPLAKKAEAVTGADIWVTAKLKEAAKALQNSWEISHAEMMTDLGIRDVSLKFAGEVNRAAFYEDLVRLAGLVNPNFPSTYPLPKLTSKSQKPMDEVWLNFWFKYFLPDTFDAVMQDVAGTDQNTIPAQPEIFVQAKAYLTTYGPGFIRMSLVANEGAERGAVESLTNSLREAQTRLMNFLEGVVYCMSDPEIHRVIIKEDGRFEVDGVNREFTGAAMRAVLALAHLRKEAVFKLDDFARLYHGGKVIDARTDFDNAMKALKKELPKTAAQPPSHNHRSVIGIKFLVFASDDSISKRLASFYKK